jgi:hypothetical protein
MAALIAYLLDHPLLVLLMTICSWIVSHKLLESRRDIKDLLAKVIVSVLGVALFIVNAINLTIFLISVVGWLIYEVFA